MSCWRRVSSRIWARRNSASSRRSILRKLQPSRTRSRGRCMSSLWVLCRRIRVLIMRCLRRRTRFWMGLSLLMEHRVVFWACRSPLLRIQLKSSWRIHSMCNALRVFSTVVLTQCQSIVDSLVTSSTWQSRLLTPEREVWLALSMDSTSMTASNASTSLQDQALASTETPARSTKHLATLWSGASTNSRHYSLRTWRHTSIKF